MKCDCRHEPFCSCTQYIVADDLQNQRNFQNDIQMFYEKKTLIKSNLSHLVTALAIHQPKFRRAIHRRTPTAFHDPLLLSQKRNQTKKIKIV